MGLEGAAWREVKEASCPKRLSEEEPEPPAADMARSALRLWQEGRRKCGVDHMTRVYYFISKFITQSRVCGSYSIVLAIRKWFATDKERI